VACAVEIEVNTSEITNLPLTIHSDVPKNGNLDLSDDHTFSCDLNADRESYPDLEYEIDLLDLQTQESLLEEGWTLKDRNSLLVQVGSFIPGKRYALVCEATGQI
jgi:hypothetical protein